MAIAEALDIVKVGKSEWLFRKYTPSVRIRNIVGVSVSLTEVFLNPSATKMITFRPLWTLTGDFPAKHGTINTSNEVLRTIARRVVHERTVAEIVRKSGKRRNTLIISAEDSRGKENLKSAGRGYRAGHAPDCLRMGGQNLFPLPTSMDRVGQTPI